MGKDTPTWLRRNTIATRPSKRSKLPSRPMSVTWQDTRKAKELLDQANRELKLAAGRQQKSQIASALKYGKLSCVRVAELFFLSNAGG